MSILMTTHVASDVYVKQELNPQEDYQSNAHERIDRQVEVCLINGSNKFLYQQDHDLDGDSSDSNEPTEYENCM